jgi:hypothetical protein
LRGRGRSYGSISREGARLLHFLDVLDGFHGFRGFRVSLIQKLSAKFILVVVTMVVEVVFVGVLASGNRFRGGFHWVHRDSMLVGMLHVIMGALEKVRKTLM